MKPSKIEKFYLMHPNIITYYINVLFNKDERRQIKKGFKLVVFVGEYKPNQFWKYVIDSVIKTRKQSVRHLQENRKKFKRKMAKIKKGECL